MQPLAKSDLLDWIQTHHSLRSLRVAREFFMACAISPHHAFPFVPSAHSRAAWRDNHLIKEKHHGQR